MGQYVPTQWRDDESGGTPITAARLNKIEEGIRLGSELDEDRVGGKSMLVPGRFYGFLGDSITNGSTASNFAYSFSAQAVQMVGATVALPGFVESGVPGQVSAAVLARVDAFTATAVDAAVLLVGTNDAGQGVTLDQFASNVTAIITALRAAGISPVLCTVPPRSGAATATNRDLLEAYNLWIRVQGPLLGARIADVHSVLVDTTTGYLAAIADSGDGVHPNDLGHQRMAMVVARQMREISNTRRPRGVVVSKTARNGVADPLSARSNAGDWFEYTGNNTGVTISIVPDTFAELPAGQWTQWDFDATAAGGRRLFSIPGIPNGAAGEKLVVAAHVQIEDTSGTWEAHVAAGTASVGLSVVNADTLQGVSAPMSKTAGIRRTDNPAVYDVGPLVVPFDAPSGVTTLALIFYVTLPTGDHLKLRAGAVGLINATQLGAASQFAYPQDPIYSPA